MNRAPLRKESETALRLALEEDRFEDDVTASLLGSEGLQPAVAYLLARQSGVFSGAEIIAALPSTTGDLVPVHCLAEGATFTAGDRVASFGGPVSAILSAERSVLNLLSRLCGVATRTREYVDAVQPFPTRVLATRKTTPGLRALELAAVTAGGGLVHRRSLSDAVLIKENHQRFVPGAELLRRARKASSPLHRVEIEVQSLEELTALGDELPDVIMLDNFSLSDATQALKLLRRRVLVEASGTMTPGKARAFAELGVDFVSAGSLTHSVPLVDLCLEWETAP